MEKVSIVRCNSYTNKEVRKALEENLKNINFKFKKNMKVLIKPNLLSPAKPEKAITTHPVIVEELCKILKEYNAEIYIGDSSGSDTTKAFEVCGIKKLSKYGKIINFEGQDKNFFDFESVKRVPLPKILFQVDLIINVPKLKTHDLTLVTLCVKNLYGCIPGKLKSYYHKIFPSAKKFSRLLFELHEKIKPKLNIIDGIEGLEGDGPGASGEKIKSKLLITSRNAGAADIVASEIMGFNPQGIYTNQFSGIRKKDIEIVGAKNIKLNFKKPSTATPIAAPIFYFVNGFFPRPKIKFNYKKCKLCHLCEEKCPVKAIKLSLYPECNHKKCIRCLCCIEICPNNAISLQDHWTKNAAREIYKRIKKVFKK